MTGDPEPRQRTVAELLAENGGAQSGRRRRRRAAEDDDAQVEAGPPTQDARPAPPAGGPAGAAQSTGRFAPEPPQAPPRNGYVPGGPNGQGRNGHSGANGHGAAPNGFDRNGYAPVVPDQGAAGPNGAPPPPPPGRPAAVPASGWRGQEAGPPGGVRTPGRHVPPDDGVTEPESPTGAFGARTPAAFGAPPPDAEGGPPTQLGAPPLDDDALDDFDQRAWTGEMADGQGAVGATAPHRAAPADGDPPTQAGFAPGDLDESDEGNGEAAADAGDDPGEYHGGHRRAAVAGLEDGDLPEDTDDGKAAGTGQAWAMVIAQWVGGAVVGAGVWVGFRYLWYSLPVVALALAVVLTVGLVLGVRALLRNDDLRTTMFAVLVGLLLTVSPALLVLLDR